MRHRTIRWARRTGGRLTLLLGAVVVVGLAAGTAGAVDVAGRGRILDDVAGHSGPVTVAAVKAYRALSDADAISASAFLAAGAEPVELRTQYQQDIAAANAALSTAASGATTAVSATKVAELTNYIPTYTGLVETARAYNRLGLPLGAAYLREASELLRTRMLPAAQELYLAETDRLEVSQASAGGLPWVALILAVLLLGCLGWAQIYLRRKTKRVFNLGLLGATALALAGTVWLTLGTLAAAAHGEASRRDGSAHLEALARARIAALEARSDEAMTLVARGNGAAFDQHFDATADALTKKDGLLDKAQQTVGQPETRAAIDAVTWDWLAAHRELRRLDTEGRYADAIRTATGTNPAARLDGLLDTAFNEATARFERATRDARNALSGLAAGIAVCCALTVLTAAAGMWPRIAEYR